MTLSRGLRRTVVALATLALAVTLVIVIAPYVIGQMTLYYLDQAGVTATIGNVDANLFTGAIEYANAEGQSERGDGFEIGRLALNLNYLPLFSKRLEFSRIAVADTRIDIHRTADNTLRVAGITMLGGPSANESGSSWQLGLQRLRLATLKIVYTQPGKNSGPAVKREVVFNESSAADVVTWQAANPVTIDADMAVADGQISVNGKIKPFGDGVTADLGLVLTGFPLKLVAPIAQNDTLTRLIGTIDTDSQIKARYKNQSGLQLTIDGQSQWHDSRLVFANGLETRSDRFDWNGTLNVALLTPEGKPSRVETDGTASIQNLKAIQPESMTLTEAQSRWQGKTRTRLGVNATKFIADGGFQADTLHLNVVRTLTFDAQKQQWQGHAEFDVGDLFAQRLEGQLSAHNARLEITGSPLAIATDRFSYEGALRRTPDEAQKNLVLHMAGRADATNLAINQTRIDAPWIAAGSAQAEGFAVAGVNDIRFARLTTKELRLLGDTNSSASVLAAAEASAQDFKLENRRRYRLANLDINQPAMHLRRSVDGMGVLTKFFASNKTRNNSRGAAQRSAGDTTSTYAIDKLKLANGQLAFVDTAVDPTTRIQASNVTLAVENLDTGDPERNANYRLSAQLGEYGRIDSSGEVAPVSTDGVDMDIEARMRSLAMAPLSGYMNYAMSRGIARGSADADLELKARNGQLDGEADIALSNFQLANGSSRQTELALGVTLDAALSLVRSSDDVIKFSTDILGDFTNPQFSIKNLVREAIFAGVRTAVTSTYSPLGLLGKAGKAISNIGQALSFHPIAFEPGAHDLSDDARDYLREVGTAMSKQPGLTLTLTGHAVPRDAAETSFFGGANINADNRGELAELGKTRAKAVRDYLAARGVATKRLPMADASIEDDKQAQPRTTLSLKK